LNRPGSGALPSPSPAIPAAAATLAMFLITAGIVVVQYRIVRRWRHAFVV
jgi:hypothetical protein